MKNTISSFDLEAAFKALDEIEIPNVGHVLPNRTDLHEHLKRVDKTGLLVEEYYDLANEEEVDEAVEDREAEIAKAKLDRIEKIVDLDADNPDELLNSYAGKLIIQCPQCMTLFYKNEEDVVPSEEDPLTVNIEEACQHCGNTSGYTLVGKVQAIDETEVATEEPVEEFSEEDMDLSGEEEFAEESGEEELPEEGEAEEEADLEAVDLDEEEPEDEEEEEEEVEESLKPEGQSLVEDANEAKATNTEDIKEAVAVGSGFDDLQPIADYAQQVCSYWLNDEGVFDPEHISTVIQDGGLDDDIESTLSEEDAEYFKMLVCDADGLSRIINDFIIPAEHWVVFTNTSKKPRRYLVSRTVEDMDKYFNVELPDSNNQEFDWKDLKADYLSGAFHQVKNLFESCCKATDIEDIDEECTNKVLSETLTNVYENVTGFSLTGCTVDEANLVLEGKINYTSGNARDAKYVITEAKANGENVTLYGINEDLNVKVAIRGKLTESKFTALRAAYKYNINEKLVEGYTQGKKI